MTLSIIVPAYNEERRVGVTLQRICEYLRNRSWDWEVRVVDDGSTDRTAAIAASTNEPRVVVMREPHRGKGGAIKAGLIASSSEFRFISDADLSMPIHEIERFLPPVLEGFDVAIATREGPEARRVGEPGYRHLIGRAFNKTVQMLVLPGIEDSQCGFKMFTADAVGRIFPLVSVDGWAFDVEVLAVAREQRLRVVEVPIEWHYGPDSRLNLWRDGVAMFAELLRIRRRAAQGLYRPAAAATPIPEPARSALGRVAIAERVEEPRQ